MKSTAVLRRLVARRTVSASTRPLPRTLSTLPPLSSRPLVPKSLRCPSHPTRFNSSLAIPDSEAANTPTRPPEPSYQLTFTCKPCSQRSTHTITKHGYHKGTVLITCPSCSNRHIISDHLNIFMDQKSTLEDILKRKQGDLSNLLKKGKLGMRQGEVIGREGDEGIEFWEDGTQTEHKPAQAS